MKDVSTSPDYQGPQGSSTGSTFVTMAQQGLPAYNIGRLLGPAHGPLSAKVHL